MPPAPEELYGSAPHKDLGFLTLLARDDVGGLQVQTPAGQWVDLPPRDDAFSVNVGNILHRMSNGTLLSMSHRVINTSGRERYLVPSFFDPHVSATIAPLPGTGPAQFETLHIGTLLKRELEVSYGAHQPDKPEP